MTRRVAVTGIGALSGYGRGAQALWDGLVSGTPAVRDHRAHLGRRAWMSYRMASFPQSIRAIAAELPKRAFVEQARVADDPDLVALADCVAQAIRDARLSYDPQANDVGLIVSHESPGLAPHVQSFFRWRSTAKAWLRSPSRFNPAEFLYEQQSEGVYRLHAFLYIHCLSAIFDLHGFTLYNNNACSSGAFAIAVAADRIRGGDNPAMVVVAGDLPEDGTKYRWFRDLGLYSASGACRPFAAARDGMVLGSGAAALVLEEMEAAVRRGATIYGEYLGGGFTSDGWKVTMPDAAHGRYGAAIASALRASGLGAAQVTTVVPHGLGTGLFDRFEASSLAEIFGGSGAGWPSVMALKGALGHTLGGCVLVETAASLLAMKQGEVPALARCEETDPALGMGRPRREPEGRPWVLLKCTNGFAGQNGAVVFRSLPPALQGC